MAMLPYETADTMGLRWTDNAYDLIEAQKLVVTFTGTQEVPVVQVSGLCPRCGDPFTADQVLAAALANGDVLGDQGTDRDMHPDAGSWRRIVVSCECTEPHDGRPAERPHGCGITYVIEIDENSAG
ncbi:hypothetical protein ACQEVI_26355 [Promicromonospora sp. CA-289599]|uniref:hypothetical protein n=1 Tax=Promicromonospora sp. CA-289599 TaxID=3240014 RepID=UPI003D8A4853